MRVALVLVAAILCAMHPHLSFAATTAPNSQDELDDAYVYRLKVEADRFYVRLAPNGTETKSVNNHLAFEHAIYLKSDSSRLNNLQVFSDNTGMLKNDRYSVERIQPVNKAHLLLAKLQALASGKAQQSVHLEPLLAQLKQETFLEIKRTDPGTFSKLVLQVLHLATLQLRPDLFSIGEQFFLSHGFEGYRLHRLKAQLLLESGDLRALKQFTPTVLSDIQSVPAVLRPTYLRNMLYFDTMARMLLKPTPDNLAELEGTIDQQADESLTGTDLATAVDWLTAQWSLNSFQGEHAYAEQIVREAIAYATTAELGGKLLDLRNNLSVSLMMLGRVADARVQLGLAYSLAEEFSDSAALATYQFNLAELNRRLGDLDQSRYYLNRARALFIETGDSSNVARTTLKLASLDRSQSKAGGLVRLWDDAEFRALIDTPHEQFSFSQEVLRDLLALDRTDEAIAHLRQRRQTKNLLPHQLLDRAIIGLRIANRSIDTQQSVQDLAVLENLVNTESLDAPFRRLSAITELVHYHTRMGHGTKAKQYAAIATNLIEHVSANMLNIAYRDDWARAVATSVSTITQIYDTLPRTEQHVGELFNVLERIYTVRPSLEGRKHAIEVDPSDLPPMEQALWSDIRRAERLGIEPEAIAASEQPNRLKDLKERYAALRLSNAKSPSQPSPTTSVKSLQERIPLSHLVVRYFISNEQSFLLAIRRSSIEYISLPGMDSVQHITEQVSKNLQTNSKLLSTDVALESLIPIGHLLDGVKRIVVIGDGEIHRLPLEAADIGGALGLRFEFVRAFSAAEYYTPKQYSAANGWKTNIIDDNHNQPTFSVFTDPLFAETALSVTGLAGRSFLSARPNNLPKLPFTRIELKSIQDHFHTTAIRSYSGEKATLANLIRKQTRRSRVLHIASHGFQKSTPNGFAGIFLSPAEDGTGNSFISVHQLLAQKFETELVVVSGCETMVGTNQLGRGMNSLVRGLAAQGAGGVMATLWPVSDRGAANFIRSFYEQLSKTPDDVERALLHARQVSAKTQPLVDWAAFTLTSTRAKVLKTSLLL